MLKCITFAASLLASTLGMLAQSTFPTLPVSTEAGQIAGRTEPHTLVATFKGIPFAAPPVGDLRWRPPQPAPHWQAVRDGSNFGPSCMQRTVDELLPWTAEFMPHGQVSEDCLFLNVWTPHPARDANLPVIVYIPGGGFTGGSGSVAIYDGTDLASTGLVIVTLNYRLGAFGFLAHPELTVESRHRSSGNYGLLDQIAALRWVRDNIKAFGGDPGRVTIWGQSAGAFSVGDLLVSPEAKGLFQRAMADSGLGVAGLHMLPLKAAEGQGVQFATAHRAHSLREMRALPAADLLGNMGGPSVRFSPIVDGWVLPDTPEALSREHKDSDVPVLTGYQANDRLLTSPPVHSGEAFHARTQHLYGPMTGEFERLYPADTLPRMQEALQAGDRDRDRVSMFLWSQARLKTHKQPVFTYFFDRAIPWPEHPEFQAFHTGEIPYFFRNFSLLNRPYEPVDFDLARICSAYLKAFAGGGDPNAPGLPQWPAVDALPRTMELGETTAPMPLADPAKLDFWTRYFNSPQAQAAPPF